MAENERLREALLELESLRDRESRLLVEGQIGLQVLTDLGRAPDLVTAFRQLVTHCCTLVGAQSGTVVLRKDDGLQDALTGDVLPLLPVNVLTKPRNLVDVQGIEGWTTLTQGAGRSVMTHPIDGGALILIGRDRAQFSAQNLAALKRLCALMAGALQSVDLRSKHALLAAVIAGSSSGFAIADAQQPDQPLIFINDAFEKLSGYAAAEVLGQNCRFLNDEPKDSPEQARLKRAVDTKTGGRFLLRNKRKSGEPFWNDLTLSPVQNGEGVVTHLVATQTDASVRVLAEKDRDETQRRMQTALAHTADAFVLLDAALVVQFSNEATRDLFPAGKIGWAVGSRFDENWDAYLTALPASLRPQNNAFLAPDIERLVGRSSGLDVAMPNGRVVLIRANRTETGGIVISATDVTALKTAERQARQRSAAIYNAQDGIGISDAKGRMIYANPSLAKLLGQDEPDDVLGLLWQRRYKTKADSEFATSLAENGTAKGLFETKDNLSFHELSLTNVEGVGTVLVVQDVTKRIQDATLQAETEKALERARQREVLSELAAGIAHDFNNILSVINGSAVLLATDPGLHPDMEQHVDRIARAGKSAAKLVNHMLDLGRADSEDGMYDLKWAVDEAMTLATASVAAQAQVTHKIAKAAFPVFGAPNDAVQILMNLIINASDALNDGPGGIAVHLDPVTALPAQLDVGQPDPAARFARLRVKDTGHGMSDDIKARMFEPQFSTKGPQGSGVGLSTVATMLDRMGGGIEVTSAPGTGTQFDIYWPLAPDTTDVDDALAHVSLDGKMVLVVDDDRAVTDVLQSYLERLGAEVAVCHDPQIAIEAITEDPNDWDFLITDYDMPGLSGGDVVAAVRHVTLELPIFVVTALARRLTDHRITAETVTAVFAKPLNLSKLAQAMERAAGSKDET